MPHASKYTKSNLECQSLIKQFKERSTVSPQVGKGHCSVRLEVHILEALTSVHWIHSETLPFILIVLRKTWGFMGKLSWSFSYDGQNNCRGIKGLLPPDINDRTIIRSIQEAEDRNIIVAVRENGKPSTYGFNKHYDTWIYDKELKGAYGYIPSQSGDIEVSGDTRVRGDSKVSGDIEVSGDTRVRGSGQLPFKE